MLVTKPIQQIRKIGFFRLLTVGCTLMFLSGTGLADSPLVTKENIRDAILQIRAFSEDEISAMDLNSDNVLDISDLVYLLKNEMSDTLAGEYTGFFVRDNVNRTAGQSEVFGQVPLTLLVVETNPLLVQMFGTGPFSGYINHIVNSQGEIVPEYNTLYFPIGQPVTVTNLSETPAGEAGGLDFTVVFEFVHENLSPDRPLLRTIAYVGGFGNAGKTVLSGTYTETITGFVDNQNQAVPIQLTGKFILIKEET